MAQLVHGTLETTASLFMGFTGFGEPQGEAEGSAPLRTRKSWVLPSVNREGVTVYYLATNIHLTFPAYVCVYYWTMVAFSGPIIFYRSNEFNNERISTGS